MLVTPARRDRRRRALDRGPGDGVRRRRSSSRSSPTPTTRSARGSRCARFRSGAHGATSSLAAVVASAACSCARRQFATLPLSFADRRRPGSGVTGPRGRAAAAQLDARRHARRARARSSARSSSSTGSCSSTSTSGSSRPSTTRTGWSTSGLRAGALAHDRPRHPARSSAASSRCGCPSAAATPPTAPSPPGSPPTIVCVSLYTADKAAYLSTDFATLWEERNLIYLSPLLLVGTVLVFEARRLDWRVVAAAIGVRRRRSSLVKGFQLGCALLRGARLRDPGDRSPATSTGRVTTTGSRCSACSRSRSRLLALRRRRRGVPLLALVLAARLDARRRDHDDGRHRQGRERPSAPTCRPSSTGSTRRPRPVGHLPRPGGHRSRTASS